MRVLMILVLMLVSGSAWADALKVKVKSKNYPQEHRHDKHDNRAEWVWRRPAWSLFHSNGSHHHRHKRYTINNLDHRHYSGYRVHNFDGETGEVQTSSERGEATRGNSHFCKCRSIGDQLKGY